MFQRLLIVIAAFTAVAFAQATQPGGQGLEQAAERMSELKSRLKLTPDQEEKVKPILQEEGEQLKALKPAGGFQSLSRPEKRKTLQSAKSIRSETDKQLGGVLSKDQMSELKKFRSEQKERMKEQFRARRG